MSALCGLSPHTIKSYRDALVLFLRFASSDARRPIERLAIATRLSAYQSPLDPARVAYPMPAFSRRLALRFIRFGGRFGVLLDLRASILAIYGSGKREYTPFI